MTASARNYPLAAMFALLAFTGWTGSDTLLKCIRSEGVPERQIILIGSITGVAVVFLYCVLRGEIKRLKPRKWAPLFAIGLAQWAAFMCWLMALPHLPLANLYVVIFLTPMIVAVLAALILKEHLGWKRGLAIAAGFAGVVVAVDPTHLSAHAGSMGSYAALLGSVAGNVAQMLILRVVAQKETSECTSFYPRFVLFAAGAAACLMAGFTPMSLKAWLFSAASGVLGAGGWVLMARAYKNAAAASVAPFQYSQMVTGALVGYFIWADKPSPALLVGAAVIVISGIYLVRHERRLSRALVRVDEAARL
ncbi:MAG: DMT family transporter [Alphaproteobacteria bacterium]|nr:DMT family transporter [Alphaproteobacteria bacterium]